MNKSFRLVLGLFIANFLGQAPTELRQTSFKIILIPALWWFLYFPVAQSLPFLTDFKQNIFF